MYEGRADDDTPPEGYPIPCEPPAAVPYADYPGYPAAPQRPPSVRYRPPSGEDAAPVDLTPAPGAAAPSGPADMPPSGPEPSPAGPTPAALRNGAGTASLVFGSAALICTTVLFIVYPLGLLFAWAAISLGVTGRRRVRRGEAANPSAATTGLTLGTIALVVGGLLLALTLWFVGRFDVGQIDDCFSRFDSGIDRAGCVLDVLDDA